MPERVIHAAHDGDGRGWLFVLGMHRSGTSAVTGAVHALYPDELQLPSDPMSGLKDNPAHYESSSLFEWNERALIGLGGSWDLPPPGAALRDQVQLMSHLMDQGREAVSRAFPGRGVPEWKDPRNCLLLPFWRTALGGPLAAIVIWRAPMEVALSLAKRNGLSVTQGLALWEYYNHFMLTGARGLPAVVLNYDSLLKDPLESLEGIDQLLRRVGVDATRARWTGLEKDRLVLLPGLRHQIDDGTRLPKSHTRLVSELRSLTGLHEQLEPPVVENISKWSLRVLKSTAEETAAEIRDRQRGDRRTPVNAHLRKVARRVKKIATRPPGGYRASEVHKHIGRR